MEHDKRKVDDELEIIKPKAERLDRELALFQAATAKLDELNELKQTIERERHSHHESFSKLVHREKEVNSLRKVLAQLEEVRWKSNNQDHEVAQHKIDQLETKAQIDKLNLQITLAQRDERDNQMRYQLLDEEFNIVSDRCKAYETDGYVGDGNHEVNPMMMRELLKLRVDNKAYKEICDKLSVDHLQKMEKALLDERNKTHSLHTQWMAVKEAYYELKNKVESADGFGHGQLFNEDDVRDMRKQYEVDLISLRAKLHDSVQNALRLTQDAIDSKDHVEAAEKRFQFQINDLLARLRRAEKVSSS
jgi:hypothetical protein